jgi:hypothetical protein
MIFVRCACASTGDLFRLVAAAEACEIGAHPLVEKVDKARDTCTFLFRQSRARRKLGGATGRYAGPSHWTKWARTCRLQRGGVSGSPGGIAIQVMERSAFGMRAPSKTAGHRYLYRLPHPAQISGGSVTLAISPHHHHGPRPLPDHVAQIFPRPLCPTMSVRFSILMNVVILDAPTIRHPTAASALLNRIDGGSRHAWRSDMLEPLARAERDVRDALALILAENQR